MKYASRRILLTIVSVIVSLPALLVSQTTYAAGTATIYLSPASGNVAKGDILTVGIYENSGTDNINAVQANLSYSTSQLSYSGYSSSPAFSIEAQNPSGNTGSLRFGRGTASPVTGAQLVATARFKVVAGKGTAAINITSSSAVVKSTDNKTETLTITSGGYTLLPASSSTSSASSSTSNKNFSISNVKVSNLSAATATISWQTSIAASSEVHYGLSSSRYNLSASDSTLTTDHKLALDPSGLVAGTTYHFIVKSVDAGGNSAASPDTTFRTSGTAASSVAEGGQAQSSRLKAPKTTSFYVTLLATMGGVIVLAFGYHIYRRKRAESAELHRHFPQSPVSGSGSIRGTTPTSGLNSPPGNSENAVIKPNSKAKSDTLAKEGSPNNE